MKDPAGTCSSCHSPANAQTREGRGWEERTEREEGEGGSEMRKNLLGESVWEAWESGRAIDNAGCGVLIVLACVERSRARFKAYSSSAH